VNAEQGNLKTIPKRAMKPLRRFGRWPFVLPLQQTTKLGEQSPSRVIYILFPAAI
jgi:hypothetical protein